MGCGSKRFTINGYLNSNNVTMPILRSIHAMSNMLPPVWPCVLSSLLFSWSNRPAVVCGMDIT